MIKEAAAIEALKAAAFYNGIDKTLTAWKELQPNNGKIIECPYEVEHDKQDEIYWMICVLLFGNYGTSPRYGWIEDIAGFRAFLDTLTEREVDVWDE